MKAWNYKLKSKIPTKKEERDFVKNLKPSEKQYWEVPLKSKDELYPERKYTLRELNIWERLWNKITGKNWYDYN